MSTPGPSPVTETPSPLSLALGGLIALAAAVGIGRFVYTPILPLMVEDLGMTKGAAGLLASANFAGYLAGALLAATPTVPGSRRCWLIVALTVSSLTTGAMALLSSHMAFLALRFAGGIASAFVLVFASALVLDRLSAADRSDLSAVHFAGVGAGMALSAVLVSSLNAWGGGWRSRWLASGLTSGLAVGIAAGLIPDRIEPAATMTSRPSRANPRLIALVMAYGLFGFGYIITATFLVAIVRGSDQVHACEPLVWLVVGLTAAPSVALWSSVGGKIGIARAFALACGIEAVGVAASVLWLAPVGMAVLASMRERKEGLGSLQSTTFACQPSRTYRLGIQRGPKVNILELQGFSDQAMLQRALDGAFDIFPHGPKPDGVGVFAQDRCLLLEVVAREVQVGRLRSPGAFIGHFFGTLEGVVQFQGHPRMLLEDAVLDDHVVIAMEKSGLSVVVIDDIPAVVLQQLSEARVAANGRPAIAVNHRGISRGDPIPLADGRARIDVATVEHDVQRLIHGQPVVGDAHGPSLIQS
jgi:MFS family permease